MYAVGSHDEQRGKTGLAHLFEHLMFDNAAPLQDKLYDLYCTKAGGSNNAYTTFDYTCYHIDLPAHQVELGLWLESERMRSFRITDHALQTQRSVVVEEINQNVFNQPYGVWRKAQQELCYNQQSSYSWDVYGAAVDVASVTMEDAHSFFDQFYHPSNAVLCISGAVTVQRAVELASVHFGLIDRNQPTLTRVPFSVASRRHGVHETVTDAVPMAATYISVHLPGFLDNELLEAEIAATILGTGRSSVLYKALIADAKLASSVGAFVDRRAHTSLLTMYAFAANEDVTADELATALHTAVRDFELSQANLESARNRLRTSHAAELQKAHGIADTVAWTTLFWNNPTYVNTVLASYKDVPLQNIASLLTMCSNTEQCARLDIVQER
jgi:predicted Zn-dependent peptidase